MIDEGKMVANLLNRRHVVGGEHYGVALVTQRQDFLFQQFGVQRVETAERLVKNEQGRTVEHGDDKLHLLLHALGEFLQLFVPPGHDVELLKPVGQPLLGFAVRKALELGQIERLVAHLHLFVEAALLGQVTDAHDVGRLKRTPVKKHPAAVGHGDAVDDTDKGGLSGPVRPQQAKHLTFGYADAHVVERRVLLKLLDEMLSFNKIFHVQ